MACPAIRWPGPDASGQPLLGRPGFLGKAVLLLAAGNLIDVIGTYAAQPELDLEGNAMFLLARSLGLELGWPHLLGIKLLGIALLSAALRSLLVRRHGFYPMRGSVLTLRAFMRHLLHGESDRPDPRRRAFRGMFVGSVLALCGPYFAYLGYQNLAAVNNWWMIPVVGAGGVWLDMGAVTFGTGAALTLSLLLWQDYRTAAVPGPARSAVGV